MYIQNYKRGGLEGGRGRKQDVTKPSIVVILLLLLLLLFVYMNS